jgi:hypothetical protein
MWYTCNIAQNILPLKSKSENRDKRVNSIEERLLKTRPLKLKFKIMENFQITKIK